MPTKVWKEAYDVFSRILKTLVDNPDLVIEHVESSSVVDTKQMTTAEAGDEECRATHVRGAACWLEVLEFRVVGLPALSWLRPFIVSK